MVSRNIFGFLMISLNLLLGLFLSPIYGGENGQTDRAVTAKNPVEFVDVINKPEKLHRIIVYYFHRMVRCETCIEIENLTLETVEEAFEKELSAGTIEIKVINMEEDVNSHFTKEYKLNIQSVIISDMAVSNEIRWKNLDKIWDYVSDKQEFKEYIIAEVRAFL